MVADTLHVVSVKGIEGATGVVPRCAIPKHAVKSTCNHHLLPLDAICLILWVQTVVRAHKACHVIVVIIGIEELKPICHIGYVSLVE